MSREKKRKKNKEEGDDEDLTQITPVSIPTESLLVSGLKDIQEHEAKDTKQTWLMWCLYLNNV